MTKHLNQTSKFVQVVFLSGVFGLFAGCATTQNSSNGTQIAPALARPTVVPLAQTNTPLRNAAVQLATPKQQPTVISPAAGKGIVLTATAAPQGNSTVSYTDLVKFHNGEDGEPGKAYGKIVRVAVTAKGEIGYFAKRADAITFLCKSGDKTLTANKVFKGSLQGIVSGSEGWEGATIYSLKACEILKRHADIDTGTRQKLGNAGVEKLQRMASERMSKVDIA